MENNTTNTVVDTSKVVKVRTSITLAPEVLTFAREFADNEKISVSQLIEDLLISLKENDGQTESNS